MVRIHIAGAAGSNVRKDLSNYALWARNKVGRVRVEYAIVNTTTVVGATPPAWYYIRGRIGQVDSNDDVIACVPSLVVGDEAAHTYIGAAVTTPTELDVRLDQLFGGIVEFRLTDEANTTISTLSWVLGLAVEFVDE